MKKKLMLVFVYYRKSTSKLLQPNYLECINFSISNVWRTLEKKTICIYYSTFIQISLGDYETRGAKF